MKDEPEADKEALKASEITEQVSADSSVQDEELASTDEVKVYKDEGEEEESRSSENLSEEKLGLVIETEEGKTSDGEGRGDFATDENSCGQNHAVKIQKCSFFDRLPFGYPLLSSYHPYSGSSLMGELFPAAGLGLYMYNDNPPPAHMGIQPLHIDPKTGLPRTSFYGLTSSPAHPTLYTPELSQMHSPVSSLCGSYSTSLSPPSLAWLGASGILPPPPPGFPYHEFNSPQPLVVSSNLKQELSPHVEPDDARECRLNSSSVSTNHFNHGHQRFVVHSQHDKKKPYVKKPLNAYMLFMKEMRQSVIEECTLKESAAINQILGRKWHALDKSEQQKYYDMAKREKELHLQMYPGWSARDNYATHTKKKKRKKESSSSSSSTSVLLSSEVSRMRRSSDQFQNHANGTNKINLYSHRTIFDRHFEPYTSNNGCNSDHSSTAEECEKNPL